jgi:hypothetical protein
LFQFTCDEWLHSCFCFFLMLWSDLYCYQMPRGYGGVAILWHKELDSYITPLKVGHERIQCIKLSGKQNIILISILLVH